MKKEKNPYNLSKEKKEHMVSEIKTYFFKERNEEIGDLASALLLEFFIEKLAPEFFNQGVAESHKYMSKQLDDVFSLQK
jgi:uncharacterized protein (DUF2164 family)